MSPAHVVSIILNLNRRDDTLACLESLAHNTYTPYTSLVINCASTDGSSEAIRRAYPDTPMLALADNRGYAGGNNVGLAWALSHGADWVLVLNEDTILAPDCIARLIAIGESDQRIGIVGPMIYHFDEPNVIQTAGGMLGRSWSAGLSGKNEQDTGQFREPHPVDWISGCAMLLRRSLLEQVGGFDERFFLYCEEIDLCLRASHRGWRLMQVPQAKLWHKGVQRNYRPAAYVTYYTTRNHFLLLQKNHAPLDTWLRSAAGILRTLSSWTLKPKWRAMRPHRDAMLRGLLDFARQRWGMQAAPGPTP